MSSPEYFSRRYSRNSYRIVEIDLNEDEFIEGAGDLLWNPNQESIWGGFGHRSTRAAVDQFAALMEELGFEVRKLELVDPHYFHLNLCLAPLTPEALLIYPRVFSPKTLASIHHVSQVFEITGDEVL